MTHPSVEDIAEHLEGLLDHEADERVRTHLAECADCSVSARDVTATAGLLRSAAETVPPMPEHLAGRVQGAIADESRRRAEVSAGTASHQVPVAAVSSTSGRTTAGTPDVGAASGPSKTPGVTSLAARRQRRRRRIGGAVLAAAAVTVVAVSVNDIWQGVQGGSADSATAGGSAGATSSQAEQQGSESGRLPPSPQKAQPDQLQGADAQSGPEAASPGPPPNAARVATRSALIEGVAAAHDPQSPGEDRPACVTEALGDAAASGASYSVDLASGPGTVVLRPSDRPTHGVLLACGPVPRVLLRLPLTP